MELSPLGAIVIPLTILVAAFRPSWLLPLTILVSPMQASAVLNVHGPIDFGLQPSFFVGSIWLVSLLGRLLLRDRLRVPRVVVHGVAPLFVFAGWALITAAVLPLAFQGKLDVGYADGVVRPLQPSTAHVTQWLYLLFGVLVATGAALDVRTADRLRVAVRSFLVAGLIASLYGFFFLSVHILRVGPMVASLKAWFHNSVSFLQHTEGTLPIGVPRMSSFLAEPSMAAHFFVGYAGLAIGVFGARPNLVSKKEAVVHLAISMAAAILTLSSTALATIAVWVFIGTILLVLRRRRAPLRTTAYGSAVVIATLFVLSLAYAYVLPQGAEGAVSALRLVTVEKLQTESGISRMRSVVDAVRLLGETWGLGVGWGSQRMLSFLTTVLASTGLVGFVLLVWSGLHIWRIVIAARRRAQASQREVGQVAASLGLSLLWMMTAAALAVPDVVFTYFWIAIGLVVAAWSIISGAKRECPPGQPRHTPASMLAGKDAY